MRCSAAQPAELLVCAGIVNAAPLLALSLLLCAHVFFCPSANDIHCAPSVFLDQNCQFSISRPAMLAAEVGNGGTNVNFSQLLEDGGLEQQLRGLADVPAMQAFVATWLAQQWPQLEAAMMAGRAAALDRCAVGTCCSTHETIRFADYYWSVCPSLLGSRAGKLQLLAGVSEFYSMAQDGVLLSQCWDHGPR